MGSQPDTSQALDYLMAFILIAALAVGIVSVLIGKFVEWKATWSHRRHLNYAPSGGALPSAPPAAPRETGQEVAWQEADVWFDDTPPQTQRIKLSTVALADNVLVVGQKNAGKTTLLKKIVMQRKHEECTALDPHTKPNKWPCKTVGAGRDYAAIGVSLRQITWLMDKRFKQLGLGEIDEGQFPRRSVVSDEYRSIADELNGKSGTVDAGKLLLSRISEGRKVGECALVACHNDTVEALGIQGNADMKTCFDYIIYMGALVDSNRTNKAPQDVKDAARQLERPAIAWHPERNNWYVLDDDLPLPTVPKVLSVSGVSKKDDGPERLIPQALRLDDEQPPVLPYTRGGTNFEGIPTAHSNQESTSTGNNTKNSPIDDEADTNAVPASTEPPLFLSDDDLIMELVRRGKSANLIADVVGGKRSAVLEKVRKLKENT
jgi:hypothetical protein